MRNVPAVPDEPVRHGVFVGLATLDVIHRVIRAPGVNEKITAEAQFVSAGGPAANAAVTFAGLGGISTLITALGRNPIARLIIDELSFHGVTVIDVDQESASSPPISAVTVTVATGDRSVVGGDAVSVFAEVPKNLLSTISGAQVVLIDGHHPKLAVASAAAAREAGIPVIVDAGRWKPVMADLIPLSDNVVCSNDFRIPHTDNSTDTALGLVASGIATVVTTDGGEPVRWWSDRASGSIEVPHVIAVDTLGAGDVFHGAYAYYATTSGLGLEDRIRAASRVAALRCANVGPRAWLSLLEDLEGLEIPS
jgi:sugar/nucleoside kinase (ribokinase family)